MYLLRLIFCVKVCVDQQVRICRGTAGIRGRLTRTASNRSLGVNLRIQVQEEDAGGSRVDPPSLSLREYGGLGTGLGYIPEINLNNLGRIKWIEVANLIQMDRTDLSSGTVLQASRSGSSSGTPGNIFWNFRLIICSTGKYWA